MRVRIATDQKRVVLSERKDATFVRAGCDFQIDLHRGLAIDTQIVKRYFVNVAGIEPRAAVLVVFRVVDLS